jgi:hypothetical protein
MRLDDSWLQFAGKFFAVKVIRAGRTGTDARAGADA